MARSSLLDTTQDLMSDGGSVLWSIVTGEQLEFPIVLNFLDDTTLKVSNNYFYEAVVIEADNTVGQLERPTIVKESGVQTVLNIRIPALIGEWDQNSAYNREEIVSYDSKYFKLLSGAARIDSTQPDIDPFWEETTLNKIYIQFEKTLGATWSQSATVATPVYGFFELRVTEPDSIYFTRTWKPIRGMVELLFSPTQEVPD